MMVVMGMQWVLGGAVSLVRGKKTFGATTAGRGDTWP